MCSVQAAVSQKGYCRAENAAESGDQNDQGTRAAVLCLNSPFAPVIHDYLLNEGQRYLKYLG